MPTFAALEDFPVGLRSRLVVPLSSSSSRQASGQKEQHQHQHQHQALLSLETPYSLLLHDTWHYQRNIGGDRENTAPTSHNDTTVPTASTSSSSSSSSSSLSRPMDAHAVQTIRREIARSLHCQTACGQQQQRAMAALTGILSSEQQQQSPFGPTGFVSVATTLAWQQSLARPIVQWRGRQNCHRYVDNEDSDYIDEVVNTLLSVHHHQGNHHHHYPGWTWGQVYHISSEDAFATATTHLLLPSLVGGTAAAAAETSTPNIAVYYLLPAYLSPTTLAQTINAVAPQLLHQIRIDTYRDDHDLALAVAQVENTLQNDGGGQQPWWVVVILPSLSAMTNKHAGPRSSSYSSSLSSSWRRWHRLVRLYHGIVVLLTPSATYEAVTPIHLHLDQEGHRLTCQQHVNLDKVGRSVSLMAQSSSYLSQSL